MLDSHAHALRDGFRCCRHCDSVARRVAEEKREIEEYCKEHELVCLLEPGVLVVNTDQSQWRIIPRDTYLKLQLFHRNWMP